jgi:peptidylprolyl isomerase
MPFKNGDKVRVHYTGTLADGTIFDSSREREPLEFILGTKTLLAGFEDAVAGSEVGHTVRITIPAEHAYGEMDPELVFSVARMQVPGHIPLEVGTHLQLSNEQGEMDVVITEVGEDDVILDANHPLAGKDLTFEIEILNND